MSNKFVIRVMLAGLYIAGLLLPLLLFFSGRGGVGFLDGAAPGTFFKLLFPLVGLYAFTFVAFQILIGSNMRLLRRIWPGILRFHRAQGSFALLFAVLHPGFILLGYGIARYVSFKYVVSAQVGWLMPAYAALTILLMTTGTAFLAWRGKDISWWRKLHKLNYVVFILAWLHSWFIGTDTQATALRAVWVSYLVLVVLSVTWKYFPMIRHAFLRRKPL